MGDFTLRRWYVAATQPCAELVAEEQLGLQGFQPFVPKCLITRTTRGRRVTTERPYLPSYVFVRFDIDDDYWGAVNNTRGVKRLICSTPERPSAIRDDAMKVILDRCVGQYVKADEIDSAWSGIIKCGTVIKVTDGPFEGFEGPVMWSHADRVRALFTFFGAQREIPLSVKQVAVVGEAARRVVA